jgi:hypothetical protein
MNLLRAVIDPELGSDIVELAWPRAQWSTLTARSTCASG